MSAALDPRSVRRWLAEFALLIDANAAELTELDAAIGDADHGTNMRRGTSAVVEVLTTLPPDTGVGGLLKSTAMTLISKVGGASGPLYGTLFLRMAAAVGSAEALDGPEFAAAFRAGVEGLAARGKAVLGDKTMYDAVGPCVRRHGRGSRRRVRPVGCVEPSRHRRGAGPRQHHTPGREERPGQLSGRAQRRPSRSRCDLRCAAAPCPSGCHPRPRPDELRRLRAGTPWSGSWSSRTAEPWPRRP